MVGARFVLAVALLLAAPGRTLAGFFDVLPPVHVEPGVPEIDAVTGWPWGGDISDPDQIAGYARLLAERAPGRVRLLEYGRTLEGRPLQLLIIGSPANIAGLDALRASLDRLADPRSLEVGEAERLLRSLPAVVWIACSVHGDETSGGDAGLALAYLLAAGDSPEIRAVLDGTLVIVDPAQNPDGRARFVASTRQARGPYPDPDPASAEHVQPWPGGRYSHDLFDLNRDWFALTHPETVGRVREMLRWHPVAVADLHEMGADMGYFFSPPASPYHPLVTPAQVALWDIIGRANAAAFDAHGWRYWTRELFDAFYPGYGESWPYFSGAIGMTYEQASSRGRVMKLRDGSTLTYGEAVQHHLVTSFTTCLTVARERERFMRSWFAYRQAAIEDGRKGAARAYLLEPGADQARAAELAELLARQGLEVFRATGSGAAGGIAAGSFVVPLDQPLGRLARTLLERHVPMGEPFEKEQERRDRRRLGDEIYDLTAWSLPLLWNVPVRTLQAVPARGTLVRVEAGFRLPGAVTGEGKVAFILPWTGPASARALVELLREGVVAGVAEKPFTLGGRRFPRGSLVIRRAGNGADLRARLTATAERFGVEFVGADTGYAEEGIDLGSSHVLHLPNPRVAVLWDTPTSPSGAGHVRHALERVFGLHVTPVRVPSLRGANLADFDVIVMPDNSEWGGGWVGALGEDVVGRLRSWVRDGGTLVAIGGAAEALAGEKVGLLATQAEQRGGPVPGTKDEKGSKDKDGAAQPEAGERRAFDYDRFVIPGEEKPPTVPGAIVRVELDREQLLSAGFEDGDVDVLVNSRRVFSPLKLDKGVNVGIYAAADQLVQSGFMLSASREQLPRKAYLMAEDLGKGHIIAFAEDPAVRGFTLSSMLLLADAVLFGPAL